MIFIEVIAAELEAKGFGTIGANTDGIHMYRMPDTVDTGILVTNRLSGTTRFMEIDDFRKTRFNIIHRGSDTRTLIDKAHAVSQEIGTKANKVLGGIKFLFINPIVDPIVMPVSAGDFTEVGVMYTTTFVINDYNY